MVEDVVAVEIVHRWIQLRTPRARRGSASTRASMSAWLRCKPRRSPARSRPRRGSASAAARSGGRRGCTPAAVGELGDVVGVHALDRERREAAAFLARAGGRRRAGRAPPSASSMCPVSAARARARAPCPSAHRLLDRGAQPDGLGDRRGAGLELVRQLVPRRRPRNHRGDHVAAGEERRHLLQQLACGRAARRPRSARAPCGRSRRRGPRPAPPVTGMWGTAWAPSTSDTAPAARMRAVHLRDGVDRAEHVETYVNATS